MGKCLGQTIMALGSIFIGLLCINWACGGSVQDLVPTFGPGFNPNEQTYRPPVTLEGLDTGSALVGCWGAGGQLHGQPYPADCGVLAQTRRRLHKLLREDE